MSRINDLIKEKCPNGVEYKKLYEVTIWDKKFNNSTKSIQPYTVSFKHTSATNLKLLQDPTGDIKLLSTGQFAGFTTYEKAKEIINTGEIISIPSGGSASIKYYKGNFVDSGNILAISKDKQKFDLKFIYYNLINKKRFIEECYRGSGVKHPDMKTLLNIGIPVPPIEVQEEIVRILDKFSELEAELEAELEELKKQYVFWRGNLLNMKGNNYYLDELFDTKNGFTPSKNNSIFWNEGTVPWFRMEDIRANGRILKNAIQSVTLEATKGNIFKKNSIIVATSATIGEHALIETDFLCNQRFTCMTLKEENKNNINMKYIYYYCFLLDDYCKQNVQQGNFNSVNINIFKKFVFKIPPLEEQERIVNILDKFDTLINDFSVGIPAEIKLRRKQYEYYRNKLLSFKELKVNE